jgi:predicted MFS family arabinose efflux permease
VSAIPVAQTGLPTWKFSPAIFAVWLAGFLPLEAAPIWIPTAQIHYGVSTVAVGIVSSVQFIVAAIAAILVAPRLAKRPLRFSLLVAMVTVLLAEIATALHPDFGIFAVLRAVEAAAAGICIAGGGMLASRTPRPSRSFGAMQFGQIIANMVMYGASTVVVVKYGLTGLYGMLAAALAVMVVMLWRSGGWPVVVVPKPAVPHKRSLRILFGGIGVAAIYCGFIALVANANALGGRAGLDFARVTIVLAITTPAGALGALTATGLSGRVPSFFLLAASALGTAICGLALTFAGLDFAWLTATLCGVILFIYVGVPSIYHGIAGLDRRGDAAAQTQGTQFLGTVIGPAAGAIIATYSVAAFAGISVLLITGGTLLAVVAIWPSLLRELRPNQAARPLAAPIHSAN